MLTLTLFAPGKGHMYIATTGMAVTPRPAPVFVRRGEETTIRVPATGSALAITSFTSRTADDGRTVTGHAGSALIPFSDLDTGAVDLRFDHRGLQGFGHRVELIAVDGDLTVYPFIGSPTYDPEQYLKRLYRNERGANTKLGNLLRAPWWAPQLLSMPLPFPAFLSSYTKIPYSPAYLHALFAIGAGRLGYTPDQAREVAAEGTGSRRARELLWQVLAVVPNAVKYDTDYLVFRDGGTKLVESFDLLLQRQCADCEDMAVFTHKLVRELAAEPSLGAFADLVASYVPISFLGTVTQPAAGTSIPGKENPAGYGGHLWFGMVPIEAWAEGRTDGIVFVEGTGIAYGIPDLDPRDEARLHATQRVISAAPGLKDYPHEVPIRSSYPGHVSAFYREVLEVHYGMDDWVESATVADTVRGYRGVSWGDFLAGNFVLERLETDSDEVRIATRRALDYIVPEPSPPPPPYIPPPVAGVDESSIVSLFYVPEGMAKPVFPLGRDGRPPQVDREIVTDFLTQFRVAYVE